MPRDNLGSVHDYRWSLSAGERPPQPGDLFATAKGTGYLVADVTGTSVAGKLKVVLVRVDPTDRLLVGLPWREWTWLSPEED